jgi:hypothetical protein
MKAARLIAILGASAGVAALLLQFGLMFNSMSAQGYDPLAIAWRYFGYFTILTNILIAVIWTGAALQPDALRPRLEGAGAVAIVMVGIIYHLLLANRWSPQGLQLAADFIHHSFTPILFGLYWLIRPHGSLKWADAGLLVVWPLAYCAYALTRGAFDGWYAYYFLDPSRVTAAALALSIAVQSAAFLACALAFVLVDKMLGAAPRVANSASAALPL